MIRKIAILAATLALVAGMYWVFNRWSPTPQIQITPDQIRKGLEVPDFGMSSKEIGDITAGPVLESRYTLLDPITKTLRRVFGFERLLNPNSPNERWRLQKPYMRIFEDSFHCWITADRGNVQVEKIDGAPSPTDAQLFDNVRIHIRSTNPKDPVEATLYMDDLNFSSDRSEFATEGPVRLYSEEAELVGRGLLLIFNAAKSRIEYLQITSPEYIRVRNLATSGTPTRSKADLSSDTLSPQSPSVSSAKSLDASKTPDAERAAMDKDKTYYQCSLNKNVVIRYGDRLVISGMDRVRVDSLEWSGRATRKSEFTGDNQAAGRAPSQQTSSSDVPAKTTPVPEPGMPVPIQPGIQNDDARDVLVTCQGSIVIRPTDTQPADTTTGRKVESEGSPIRIETRSKMEATSQGMARCGRLLYDVDSETINLYSTEGHKQIELLSGDSGTQVLTQGWIHWDRRNRAAQIFGPGTMVLPRDKQTRPTQLAFHEKIDLVFADRPEDAGHTMTIKTANLVGGMEADMADNPDSKLKSDSAMFWFDPSNRIEKVDLQGHVQYVSKQDRLDSGRARLSFDDQSNLTEAMLEGQVQLASANGQVRSRTAQVTFAGDSGISDARLIGDVEINGDKGILSSPQADIRFGRDPKGKLVVESVHSTGGSELRPIAAGSSSRPARFYAQDIQYDMATGNAIAQGPVEFTFYTKPSASKGLIDQAFPGNPADPNEVAVSPSTDPAAETALVPIVITADKQAEFSSTDNRITFVGNVVGRREVDKTEYVQKDIFRGQRLVVDLLPNPKVRDPQIKLITIRDGNVALESVRSAGKTVLTHVRLLCVRIEYLADKERILAVGPGEIELNNANAPTPVVKPGQPNLGGPCYAILDGFDSLQWELVQGRFVADGQKASVNLYYWPIVDGQMGQIVRGATTHFEAGFVQNQAGQSQIASVKAGGGVYYEEVGKNVLTGDSLDYDASTSVMTIQGTDSEPCFLNGARTPGIEYNLVTGEIRSQLSVNPGAIPEVPKEFP